jgi:hypothetical protein
MDGKQRNREIHPAHGARGPTILPANRASGAGVGAAAGKGRRRLARAARPCHDAAMRDYWLSKLFFDVQANAAEYRADRAKFLARYALKPEVKEALLGDDVASLARLANPYLLRFYFAAAGMKDEEFIRRLRERAPAAKGGAAAAPPKAAHG